MLKNKKIKINSRCVFENIYGNLLCRLLFIKPTYEATILNENPFVVEIENRKIALCKDKDAFDELPKKPKYDDYYFCSFDKNQEVYDITNGNWMVEKLKLKIDLKPDDIVKTWTSFDETTNLGQDKSLRDSQLGALYALKSHWTVSNDIAIVVLPTGTGKTDTMISVLLKEKIKKLMILVPSDALREQLSYKVMSLGILKENGIIPDSFELPNVAIIQRKFKDSISIESILENTNVCVATVQSLNNLDDELLKVFVDSFTHIFIDEAHHAPANSWSKIVQNAQSQKIVFFTATPYRNDNARIPGKIVFNYSLKKAQELGIFKQINYFDVKDYNSNTSDRSIATKAVSILRKDEVDGFKHSIMVRVQSIGRTTDIIKIYQEIAPDLNPKVISSKLKIKEIKEIKSDLLSGKVRIIICVDMLGEGFDYPPLKIAAIHDIHKSLPITIQFIGRFTRKGYHLGNASVVVNSYKKDVDKSIDALYSNDADWNAIIADKSVNLTEEQIQEHNFNSEFLNSDTIIDLRLLTPTYTTLVFCVKNPEKILFDTGKIEDALKDKLVSTVSFNKKDKIIVFITRETCKVNWSKIDFISDSINNVYIIYFESKNNFLFAYSSDFSEGIIERVIDLINYNGEVELVTDEKVLFRVFGNMTSYRASGVGSRPLLKDGVSYQQFWGRDVGSTVNDTPKKDKVITNVYFRGWEDGSSSEIGISTKGKIWSNDKANSALKWKIWCDNISEKLVGEDINIEEFLLACAKTHKIFSFVNDWQILSMSLDEKAYSTQGIILKINDIQVSILSIDFVDFSVTEKNLDFFIISDQIDDKKIKLSYEIKEEKMTFKIVGEDKITVIFSRDKEIEFTDFLNSNKPKFFIAPLNFLIGNLLYENTFDTNEFDKFIDLTWQGCDITKESMFKPNGQAINNSVQFYICHNYIIHNNHNLLINDDGCGEVADLIGIDVDDNLKEIKIHFYHCKFSGDPNPGCRVSDIYELFGQVQKSAALKDNSYSTLSRIEKRYSDRLKNDPSESRRIIFGDEQKLNDAKNKSKYYRLEIVIYAVQPGLSIQAFKNSPNKKAINEVFIATDFYLKKAYNIPFNLICSQ